MPNRSLTHSSWYDMICAAPERTKRLIVRMNEFEIARNSAMRNGQTHSPELRASL